jgi:hypothetical protein
MQRPSMGSSGGRLALTTSLSHFPELEVELELLEHDYNADLMSGEMEALCTQTRRAKESLSSRVNPSAARSPPDVAGEE